MDHQRPLAKAYTTWGLVTGFDVNENLTLRAGVLNLGDVSTVDEGNNHDGGARTFLVGAAARF